MVLMVLVLGALIPSAQTTASNIRHANKHVVFMFADDLGWGDVSFHGSQQIPTPNIDRLAAEGVELDRYFVQPVCSPSRASFLTGRHVIHTGVYHAFGNDASGDLSLNFTLLPAHLKALGYQTHLVGKWHLGYSNWNYTPVRRGFDTSFGYLGGAQDYWLHGFKEPAAYLDFVDGDEPAFNHTCWQDDACGVEFYSTHVFARKAIDIINAAAAEGAAASTARKPAPLFLYIAWQSVHSVEGPDSEQLKAPQAYIDAFNRTIPNIERRVFAAMATTLDEGVGNVTAALKQTGLWKDTFLIFSTDNGGPADGYDRNMASNWPLRGTKGTLFDGGVRGVGVVSGGMVPSSMRGTVLTGLIHVTDWYHTILRYASSSRSNALNNKRPGSGVFSGGASASAAAKTEPLFVAGDGVDVLDYLFGNQAESPRTEVLHEAHPHNSTDGVGNALRALINGVEWKIVLRTGVAWPGNTTNAGTPDGWYGGIGSTDPASDGYILPINATSQNWSVKCGRKPPAGVPGVSQGFACEGQGTRGAGADSSASTCLFDMSADPCELADQSTAQPAILLHMLARLDSYRATAVNGAAATRNPDGLGCPAVQTISGCAGGGSKSPMSCAAKLPCGPK